MKMGQIMAFIYFYRSFGVWVGMDWVLCVVVRDMAHVLRTRACVCRVGVRSYDCFRCKNENEKPLHRVFETHDVCVRDM